MDELRQYGWEGTCLSDSPTPENMEMLLAALLARRKEAEDTEASKKGKDTQKADEAGESTTGRQRGYTLTRSKHEKEVDNGYRKVWIS